MKNRHSLLSRGDTPHKPPALRTLFPALAQVRLDLEFVHDPSRPSSSHVHILHPAAAAFFRYPCPVGGCSGQFNLDKQITGLLQSAGSRLHNEVCCGGVRPQDRVSGKRCSSTLRFTAEATYGAN